MCRAHLKPTDAAANACGCRLERSSQFLLTVTPPVAFIRQMITQGRWLPLCAGGPTLFRNLNFGLDLESRFAIVGPNGIGKVRGSSDAVGTVLMASDLTWSGCCFLQITCTVALYCQCTAPCPALVTPALLIHTCTASCVLLLYFTCTAVHPPGSHQWGTTAHLWLHHTQPKGVTGRTFKSVNSVSRTGVISVVGPEAVC